MQQATPATNVLLIVATAPPASVRQLPRSIPRPERSALPNVEETVRAALSTPSLNVGAADPRDAPRRRETRTTRRMSAKGYAAVGDTTSGSKAFRAAHPFRPDTARRRP